MSSKLRPTTLAILLNQRSVGTVTRLPDETLIFAFDPEYENDPDRPILSLSYKNPFGGLALDRTRTSSRLAPFFSNLLPEGHLRDYLANALGINAHREFFLLTGLGLDLPGAVIAEQLGDMSAIKVEDSSNENSSAQALRFSLAGVQLKFSAIAESKGTFTVPANGAGGSWIVKLPSERFVQVPETEYSMLKLAELIGIAVPKFKLIPTASIDGLPREFQKLAADSLAVQRFDRTADGGRIHMEDFAQVFGVYPQDKYKKASYGHIGQVLWAEDGESSYTEFVRRLVFTVAIGNGDMHLKNWTLLYRDARRPVLSPAYDFVPTIAYIDNDKLALNLGGSKEFRDITVEKFKRMAVQARASEKLTATVVNETVESVVEVWNKFRFELGLSPEIAQTISNHMSELPLLKSKMR